MNRSGVSQYALSVYELIVVNDRNSTYLLSYNYDKRLWQLQKHNYLAKKR